MGRNDLRSRGQLRAVLLQFPVDDQDVIERISYLGRCRIYHMDKDFGTLDMSEKLMPQSNAFCSSLDQPRNIRDYKTICPFQVHHTKDRTQRCEMIIRDLWPGIADTG